MTDASGAALPVLENIAAHRLLPVVVLDRPERAAVLAGALRDGGLPVVEVTRRTPAACAVITALAAEGDLLVGAGTVLTPADVASSVEAGARFIVSPGLSANVARECAQLGVPYVPGVMTPTEVMTAREAGFGVLKFFPAARAGGAATIAALAEVFPEVRFVPTGGIGGAQVREYLSVDAVLAVGGSWMVPRDVLDAGDLAALSASVRDAVAATEARP